jgi:HAD superfamily hydrolase (TIGR01490 family)
VKPRAAFFDLDGTLIHKPSSELRFLHHLLLQRHLGARQFVAGLAFYPRWYWRYRSDVGRKNKAVWAGLEVDEIATRARQWVEENFDKLLDPEIAAHLEQCRQGGYRLVLMTGAPDFLAHPFAQHLGIDDCIATRCAANRGRFRAAPPQVHPLAGEKLTLARRWCRQQGIGLRDCAAYGDSHQDYALLRAVGVAIAVNPDRRMTRLAADHHWQVLIST